MSWPADSSFSTMRLVTWARSRSDGSGMGPPNSDRASRTRASFSLSCDGAVAARAALFQATIFCVRSLRRRRTSLHSRRLARTRRSAAASPPEMRRVWAEVKGLLASFAPSRTASSDTSFSSAGPRAISSSRYSAPASVSLNSRAWRRSGWGGGVRLAIRRLGLRNSG